jgi:ribosomal protein S27AE
VSRHKSCTRCGEPIAIEQLPGDRWRPIEPDGSPHFENCQRNQAQVTEWYDPYRPYPRCKATLAPDQLPIKVLRRHYAGKQPQRSRTCPRCQWTGFSAFVRRVTGPLAVQE